MEEIMKQIGRSYQKPETEEEKNEKLKELEAKW